ncbi:MarR family transcriptional regulator [Paenibacillus doosanensis]|uniref:HTH-type transcriptional regulator YusO n=1 Tax=Paenibacillus konkukensis TaxID=2020716 RepID=A0ABY4RW33_9BACL|nr:MULTISPECIES: MarR family transcriptional regulator [Paenibacillus]MCS7458855.1 MarR family transcriptional regulator [Paenibacillus doosanensis]UQZ86616.1 putative HTH-type transcriptional regulator YusO [Paenibacillus konkukensis]
MEQEFILIEELETSARRVMRKFVTYSKHVDRRFSGSQVSALQSVEASGMLKVSRLAEHLSLSSSAVTLLCDKLIRQGYLRRERSVDDRRVVCLVITQHGREILQELLDKEKEVVTRWLSGISIEELQQFNNVLRQIRENIKKKPTDAFRA